MSFRLPELTYPFAVDTIGKMLAAGFEMTVHCYATGCNHHGRVNLVALGRRLGMDHGCLDAAIRNAFYCPRCREAGRRDRDFGFRVTPPTEFCDIADRNKPLNNYMRAKGI
jgi:hypothetical protein